MVLDKLTLFEVHLEDASFGPNLRPDESESEDEPPVEDEADDDGCGISVGRLVVASVLLSAFVSVLAWKLAGDDEQPDVAIDAPEEGDAVDVTVED